MIHLFYDKKISSWEIATKRAIGGNYYYYHIPDKISPTYREMVIDAFQNLPGTPLEHIPFLEYLPKEYCYNFILQHPSNHIVIPIQYPKMYLVSVYKITPEKNTATMISPFEYSKWDLFMDLKDSVIYFPKIYELTSLPCFSPLSSPYSFSSISEPVTDIYSEIIYNHASIHTSITTMGILFLNIQTGERSSILNPNYIEMTLLRGNYPNIQYQYLCLNRIGKVMEFLTFFPQYRSLFYQFKKELDEFIYNIHQSYLSYYVQKKENFISKKYFSIIYKLHHEIYIPSITSTEIETWNDTKENNKKLNRIIIQKSVVKNYIKSLDPGMILHYMKFHHREYDKLSFL